jgi:glycosyltransferase involved in cell wall biosynthesis
MGRSWQRIEKEEGLLSQVAVVIPCRNETATVLNVVASLPSGLGQWLVVDNGSAVECQALLQKAIPEEHLLTSREPLGVGGAFLVGCGKLKPSIRWICKLDGDGQFSDVNVGELLQVAVESNRALVKTARCNRHGWGMEAERLVSRHLGNQLLTLMLTVATGYYLLEDGTSGLFVIERRALDAAESMGGLRHDHGFETSLLLNLGSLGASVMELRVPVLYYGNRGETFSARILALPLLLCLLQGGWRRIRRGHLVYRLSAGGVLLIAAAGLLAMGMGLTAMATIKALSQGMPTTPGISSAATSLISWGLLSAAGFVAYDFASSYRRFCCTTLFACWRPMATQGIQATSTHQAKRPS